jgi:hypothetical protein
MATAVGMMIGGAITNALAFSGSNYLFSKMGSGEIERHNKAMEALNKAQSDWNRKRIERLDFINKELQRRNHALKDFDDVDIAMHKYSVLTGKQLENMPPEPILAEYYNPSKNHNRGELLFIAIGMSVTAFIVYRVKHMISK